MDGGDLRTLHRGGDLKTSSRQHGGFFGLLKMLGMGTELRREMADPISKRVMQRGGFPWATAVLCMGCHFIYNNGGRARFHSLCMRWNSSARWQLLRNACFSRPRRHGRHCCKWNAWNSRVGSHRIELATGSLGERRWHDSFADVIITWTRHASRRSVGFTNAYKKSPISKGHCCSSCFGCTCEFGW